MRTLRPWLVFLAGAAAAATARGDTKIFVIQPGSQQLVAHVDVTIYSTGTSPARLAGGRTGLHGEPVSVKLDPAWARVRVVATRQGTTASTELTFDKDLTPWNAPFKEAGWRPSSVYDNRHFTEGQWHATRYSEWKQYLQKWRKGGTDLADVVKDIAKQPRGAKELGTLVEKAQRLVSDMTTSGDIHSFLVDRETGRTTPVGRALQDVRQDLSDLLTAEERRPPGDEETSRTFLEVQASLADNADKLSGESDRTVYPPDISVLMPHSMIPPVRIYCECGD